MTTRFPQAFVLIALFFTSFLTPAKALQATEGKFTVVLDAGHGGKDPGRPTKFGYKEKDIALKIVLAIGGALEKNPDIEVIYTRKTDKFLELHERAKIANKADADLFISIHCNAHNSNAYGTETYVLATRANNKNIEIAKEENEVIFLEADYEKHYDGFDPSSPASVIGFNLIQEDYMNQSIQLARYVEDNFKDRDKRKSRGVKQAGFWVLHNTYMPSILVETGFITNKTEGDYLNSKKGQEKTTESVVNAVLEYKKQLEQNVGENIYSQTVISEEALEERLIEGVIFKVQIAASGRDLEAKPFNFNGLSDISRIHEDGLFKYYSGNTSDYNKILSQQELAKSKGYPSSFIVAFKDGQRIAMDEALKATSN